MREIFRAIPLVGWIVMAVLLVAIVAGGWWLVTEPSRQKQKAAAAELNENIAQGQTSAGGVAVNAVADNASEKAGIDARVKESEDALRNRPGPGALNRELCKSPSYRGDPRCVQ